MFSTDIQYRFAEGDAVKAILAFQEMMLKQAGMMVLVATSHVSQDGNTLLAL